jgi:hypothetical protein
MQSPLSNAQKNAPNAPRRQHIVKHLLNTTQVREHVREQVREHALVTNLFPQFQIAIARNLLDEFNAAANEQMQR